MKRLCLVIWTWAMMLSSVGVAGAGDWEVVYETDFSSDPCWITNAPQNYHWDAGGSSFYFKNAKLVDEYAYLPIVYSEDLSYKLVFDVKLTRCDWAAYLNFGLWDADMMVDSPVEWLVRYHRVDPGQTASLLFWDSNGSHYHPGGAQPVPFSLDTWYHTEAIYDNALDTLALKVTRVSDNSVVGTQSLSNVGQFPTVTRLGISNVGDRYAAGATAEGYIDNVVLYGYAREDCRFYAEEIVEHSGQAPDALPASNVLGPPDAGGTSGADYFGCTDFEEIDATTPGFVIVDFAGKIIANIDGDEIVIHLWDWPSAEEESFEVFASIDGVVFHSLGTAQPSGQRVERASVSFDLADAGMGYAQYIKIVNGVANTQLYHEGPDIDAIEILCEAACGPDGTVTYTFQQGVWYAGTVDTMLLGSDPDDQMGTFPALLWDKVDYNTGFPIYSLLRFDDIFGSGSRLIPPNANVVQATLTLKVQPNDAGDGVDLHRMLRNWSDVDTWNTMGDGIQLDDVEAAAVADATFPGPIVANQELNIDVTASLQAWIQDPSTNLGWALMPQGIDGVRVDSAEGLVPPKLDVTVTCEPVCWVEQDKLLASDGDASDYFGVSVSASGDYAIIGADGDDDKASWAGAAYIFKRESDGWIEQTKLTASDGAVFDRFGLSVSINGDYAIVGAHVDDVDGLVDTGSAYIFKRDGETWTQKAKLTASDGAAYDRFGFRVSINGDYAIVGAHEDDVDGLADAGSAYIFKHDGETWTEQAKLTASDDAAYDRFGLSVSINGDYAIVGAYWNDAGGLVDSGAAYIFMRDGTNWIEQAKLTASDGAAYDHFGEYAAISGDSVVIGAPQDDDNGDNSGSAYIFKRDGETWTEQAKLIASDGENGDFFGTHYPSISGKYAIVAAIFHDANGIYSGSAYIFRRNGASWVEVDKLTASDGAAHDVFGNSVMSGDYIIVGAHQEGDNGVFAGAAYVFENICNTEPVAICQDVTVEADSNCEGNVTAEDVNNGSYDPDGDAIILSLEPAGPYPLGETTVTLTVSDGEECATCEALVTVIDATPPAISNLDADYLLAAVGQTVNFSVDVNDNCDDDVNVVWDFGDGTPPSSDPSHAYGEPNIYNVTVTATDDCGNLTTDSIIIVVYDPSAGFTSGGGWFVPDSDSFIDGNSVTDTVSKANFGFIVKYKKGADNPDGNLEFQYKAGDINLRSQDMEWLVVQSATKVRFKGKATINGEGSYTFKVTAEDNGEPGTGDWFKIEIWMGPNVDTENGPPTPKHKAQGSLGGGNIQIHQK